MVSTNIFISIDHALKERETVLSHREVSESKDSSSIDKEETMISAAQILKNLLPLYQPVIFIIITLIAAFILGACLPVKVIPQRILIISLTKNSREDMKKDLRTYLPILLTIGLTIFIIQTIGRFCMYYIASKMVRTLRSQVYSSLIRQPIEYFNAKENSPGNLTGVLAKEIRTVNPVSVDMYVLLFQGFIGMIAGISIALAYNRKMGFVALCCLPFMILFSVLQAREMNKGDKNISDRARYEKVIISDSVINHSTVSSMANEDILIGRYFKAGISVARNIKEGIFSFI